MQEQSVPAERGPKARTRKLMLETAIGLMQRGQTPSVRAVAEAIGALALDRDLRASMGRKGLHRVQAEFTWEIAASRVASLA